MYHATSTIILTVLVEFQTEHFLNFHKIWRICLKLTAFTKFDHFTIVTLILGKTERVGTQLQKQL